MKRRSEPIFAFLAGLTAALLLGMFACQSMPAPAYHDITPVVVKELHADAQRVETIQRSIGTAQELGTAAQGDVRSAIGIATTIPAAAPVVPPLRDADAKLAAQDTALATTDQTVHILAGSVGQMANDLQTQELRNASLVKERDDLFGENVDLKAWKAKWEHAWLGPRTWALIYWIIGIAIGSLVVGILCLALGAAFPATGAVGVALRAISGIGTFLVHLWGPIGHFIDEHFFYHANLVAAAAASKKLSPAGAAAPATWPQFTSSTQMPEHMPGAK